MERKRVADIRARPNGRSHGIAAGGAKQRERTAPRSLARLGSKLLFGLKLAAGILAVAFIAMALGDVGGKLRSAGLLSPDRAASAGSPGDATAHMRVDGELRPPPSNFPRTVKTIRFTPAGD
jgi:hypothetical protein